MNRYRVAVSSEPGQGRHARAEWRRFEVEAPTVDTAIAWTHGVMATWPDSDTWAVRCAAHLGPVVPTVNPFSWF